MTSFSTLAPIVLFAYKRPEELQRTVHALQANHLAAMSELHVYVDGPKHPFDLPKVEAVRTIVESITGFQSIHRHYATRNQGLANSIIAGVSQIMNQYGRAIVLEDDLVTSPNFLDFMNQALVQYQDQPQLFSVSGYTFPFKQPADYRAAGYLYPRTGSWGWASWADRWKNIDWELTDYESFIADKARCEYFKQYGSDRLALLKKWREGEIDSWAIRWCYAQAKTQSFTLYPTLSKVTNIGFTFESTNLHGIGRNKKSLDTGERREFIFPDMINNSKYYSHKIRRRYSLPMRVADKVIINSTLIRRWLISKY
ncbi:glycosyltransferase [Fibrella arboris]|uniref:glycosyltransferase n=1 Tax=Fibrella arboris TaxID=3242486 RepID=UPI003521F1F9